MGCACGKNRQKFNVKLPGGLTVTKRTEQEATAFAARHPGSTVIKPAQAA
jgi:hypothetical protein